MGQCSTAPTFGEWLRFEDQKLVTSVLASGSGQFWVRCKGATCEVKLKGPTGKVLGTVVLALPSGRK